MGAEQTLTSRNSQENVTSDNALSINDYSSHGLSLQRKASVANNTGLPDSLKSGVESLSGYSLDDVRVHYNSSKPAAVQAYAYTQGTDIHIAPGQERCLPHEAWHVTQQMSGRVSPTTSIGGVAVNDDASLEHEADVMGARASTLQGNNYAPVSRKAWSSGVRQNKSSTIQRDGPSGGTQGVTLVDDYNAITKFMGKKYKKTYEQKAALQYGHFDVEYVPSSNDLNVNLPVHYDANVTAERRKNYEDNITAKWNNQYHIDFQGKRLDKDSPINSVKDESYSRVSWMTALDRTKVNVKVDPVETSSGAYFDINTVDGSQSGNESYVLGRKVQLRQDSLDEDKLNKSTNNYPSLNPSAHETGHMFGLDDEYCRKAVYTNNMLRVWDKDNKKMDTYNLDDAFTPGHPNNILKIKGVDYKVERNNDPFNTTGFYYTLIDPVSGKKVDSLDGTVANHYDLTKKAFGENYANEHAVMHTNPDRHDRTKDGERLGTSVMRDGDTVEKHHYVTFWDAMVKAIQSDDGGNGYGTAASREAPNQHEDWTIRK